MGFGPFGLWLQQQNLTRISISPKTGVVSPTMAKPVLFGSNGAQNLWGPGPVRPQSFLWPLWGPHTSHFGLVSGPLIVMLGAQGFCPHLSPSITILPDPGPFLPPARHPFSGPSALLFCPEPSGTHCASQF